GLRPRARRPPAPKGDGERATGAPFGPWRRGAPGWWDGSARSLGQDPDPCRVPPGRSRRVHTARARRGLRRRLDADGATAREPAAERAPGRPRRRDEAQRDDSRWGDAGRAAPAPAEIA